MLGVSSSRGSGPWWQGEGVSRTSSNGTRSTSWVPRRTALSPTSPGAWASIWKPCGSGSARTPPGVPGRWTAGVIPLSDVRRPGLGPLRLLNLAQEQGDATARTGSTLRRLRDESISVRVWLGCDCGSTCKMAPRGWPEPYGGGACALRRVSSDVLETRPVPRATGRAADMAIRSAGLAKPRSSTMWPRRVGRPGLLELRVPLLSARWNEEGWAS